MKEKFFYLFIFFVPLEQLQLFLFGIETEFKPYRIFLFLSLGTTIFNKYFLKTRLTKELKLFIFIFSYGSIMALLRISLGLGEISYMTNATMHFFIGLIIIYLFSNLKISHKILYKIGNYFLVGVIISSLYGLFDYVITGQYRLNGFFNNPNHLAIAINLVTPFLIYKLFLGRKVYLNYITIIFFTYIVFLTGSRTGVLTQTICLFFLIFQMNRGIINLLFIVLSGFLSISLIIRKFSLGSNLISRFEQSNLKTGSGRFDIAKAALNLGVDTGFSGVGIGQYRFYHLEYISYNAYDTVLNFKLSTHNLFLDLLVNFGIISFFIFLYILLIIKRNIKKIENIQSRKIAFLFLFILLVISYSQEMFAFPTFWISISLLLVDYNHLSYMNNNYKLNND